MLDQGAYSFWRSSGGKQPDEDYWLEYEAWAYAIMARCPQAVAIVPDVIDGSEEENHRLLIDFLGGELPTARLMPVWHLGDSMDYLDYLLECGFSYLAFGSSGQYANPASKAWHERVRQGLHRIDAVCTPSHGLARPWLHLLRAQAQHEHYDFDSSDSTNLAMNHHRYRHLPGHLSLFSESIRMRLAASCDMRPEQPSPARNAIEWRLNELQDHWNCTASESDFRKYLSSAFPPITIQLPDYRAWRETDSHMEPLDIPLQPDLFASTLFA